MYVWGFIWEMCTDKITYHMIWPMHVNIAEGCKWTVVIPMSAISFLFLFSFCPLWLEDGDNMHNKAASLRKPDSRSMHEKIQQPFMSHNSSNQNCPRVLVAEHCDKDWEFCTYSTSQELCIWVANVSTMMYFAEIWYWLVLPTFFGNAWLALGQSYNCHSASETTLKNMR